MPAVIEVEEGVLPLTPPGNAVDIVHCQQPYPFQPVQQLRSMLTKLTQRKVCRCCADGTGSPARALKKVALAASRGTVQKDGNRVAGGGGFHRGHGLGIGTGDETRKIRPLIPADTER